MSILVGLSATLIAALVGSLIGLIALGFVLVYKATEVVNFAQGDLMMLGGFFAFTFIGMLGLWDKLLQTLALVLVSTGLCVLVGVPLSIAASLGVDLARLRLTVVLGTAAAVGAATAVAVDSRSGSPMP